MRWPRLQQSPGTGFVSSGITKSFSYGPSTETCAGQGLDRVFCANCGSRVFTNNLKDFPDTVFVQEGTLDQRDGWFAPKMQGAATLPEHRLS